MGPWYRRIARGGDRSPVTATPWVARGQAGRRRSRPTCATGTSSREEVRTLAARVLDDIVAEGRPAIRVGLKVRYAPFTTHTASAPLPAPTVDLAEIADAAVALLSRFDERRSVRLLGVRLEMQPPDGGYVR